jgi:hypothetical protein
VQNDNEPKTLSEIAEDAAFSMSNVAFISGLEESTVYRLWDNPDWLDKVSGRSLQALIPAVPELGRYVESHAMRSRRMRLIEELTAQGLTVDESAIEHHIAAGVPEPYLTAALQAAIHIMRGDNTTASSSLAGFWGAGQDRALNALFATSSNGGLLRNPEDLLAASSDLAPAVGRKGYSFHAIITQAVFSHWFSRATGHAGISSMPNITDRQTALTHRSSIMGLLVSNNDYAVAERYHGLVQETPVLKIIEEWSFPTYTRDARLNSDFALPRSLLLRNTAHEVMSEIESADYSDAYVFYLASTYLPIALSRDPTFGLRGSKLASALLKRADGSGEAKLRKVCEALVRQIRSIAE